MGSTKGFANLQVCFAIALFGPLTYGLPPDPGAQGYSLQKALKTTFENNKKMNSNNFKIAAIRERSEAVKKGIWPAPVFSAGFGKNFGNQTMGGDVSSTNQLSDSRSLRIDFNLWRGGADRDAARAAEAHAQAQIEAYDSTTGQIPNTKGSLAGSVLEIYTKVMLSMERKKFLDEDLGGPLYKLLGLTKDADSRIRISAAIGHLKTSLNDLDSERIGNANNFKFIVTDPLPARLQSYEQVIESLKIPETVNEALEVAQRKSHELNRARLNLVAADYEYKSQKKRIYSPEVNATASYGVDNYSAMGSMGEMSTKGGYVGISVRFPFKPGSRATIKAAQYERDAANSDHLDAIDTLANDVPAIYGQLEGYLRRQTVYEDSYADTKNTIALLLGQLAVAEDKGKIDLLLSLIGDLEGQWWAMIINDQNILMTKFRIQKLIGTLF